MKLSRSTLVATYPDTNSASRVIQQLIDADFSGTQIGIATRVRDGARAFQFTTASAMGVAVGAGGGALWALGVAAGVLPAIGAVMVGGLFGAILASTGAGSATGGLAGSLLALGMTREEADYIGREFERGRAILALRHRELTERAHLILGSEPCGFLWSRQVGTSPRGTLSIA